MSTPAPELPSSVPEPDEADHTEPAADENGAKDPFEVLNAMPADEHDRLDAQGIRTDTQTRLESAGLSRREINRRLTAGAARAEGRRIFGEARTHNRGREIAEQARQKAQLDNELNKIFRLGDTE